LSSSDAASKKGVASGTFSRSLFFSQETFMHILVTNDDGIASAGLHILANAMRPFGDVTVLAPDHNWSASGHVKTLDRPLRVKQVRLPDGSPAYASDGAPSDCVALAVCGFLKEKVDLVVSGINPYANLGHDVTYSGTVTAAMEAAIWGIPAIAFSLDTPDNHSGDFDFSTAGSVAGQIVEAFTRYGLPAENLLNVNVPALPLESIKGTRITRMGLRVYHDKVDSRTDPRGKPYYWVIGDSPTGIPERGTDFGALSEGYVSITPLHLDLTAYRIISELQSWEFRTLGQPVLDAADEDN
jgi:5'-nucleotidase